MAQEQALEETKEQSKSAAITAVSSPSADFDSRNGSSEDPRMHFFKRRLAMLGPTVSAAGVGYCESGSSDASDDDEDFRELLDAMVHKSNSEQLPTCRCSEFESCSLLWCKNQTQSVGSSMLSKLAAWSVSAASVDSLESRSVARVESPAAKLGEPVRTSSQSVPLNPMNSLESESSDDSSSLLDYDLVETNGDGQTPTVTFGYTDTDGANQGREAEEDESSFSDVSSDDDVSSFSNSSSEDSSDDDEDHVIPAQQGKALWQAAEDKATGRTYYFHRYTRETSWTCPPENYTRRNGKPVLGAC